MKRLQSLLLALKAIFFAHSPLFECVEKAMFTPLISNEQFSTRRNIHLEKLACVDQTETRTACTRTDSFGIAHTLQLCA